MEYLRKIAEVQTDRHTSRQHRNGLDMIYFLVAFFMVGLLIGYSEIYPTGDHKWIKWIRECLKRFYGWWDNYYYLWDKSKDLLCFYTLIFFVPKKIKIALSLICGFCGCRILWDFIAITDYQKATSPEVMFWMFMAWLIPIIVLMIKGIKEQWQQQ